MRITLINVSGPLSSDGSRLVSALLKRHNHQVTSVFLARREPLEYKTQEFELLDDMLKQTDLVLVAVYSSYAVRAVQITEFIHTHYPGMKVIWGGPHCISAPELSLCHADGVCFSEGDQVVVDVVNRMEAGDDYLTTPNMAFQVNGETIVNEVLPAFSDLDSLPYYDYDLDSHFVLNQKLLPMTKARLREHLVQYPYHVPIFYFLTSRGCPYQCSYCNNCRYVAMFGRNTMRFHSVDRVISELEHTLGFLDFFKFVGFGDDDFFMRPMDELSDFAEKYRRRVGLPFGIAVSARTFRKDKVELLLDAGLRVIQMGVQSGSQRVLDQVYNRHIDLARTRDVVRQIGPYHRKHGLDLLLDFIIDNPYETKDDIIKTYTYLVDLPAHVRLNVFFLAFFPGTPIYDRALKDGYIEPFTEKAFRFINRGSLRYQKNYETFLILLLRYLRRRRRFKRALPRTILQALAVSPIRGLASLCPQPLIDTLSRMIQ